MLFGLFVAAAGKNPLEVYQLMAVGAFGSWFSWQNTLLRASPLLLTALCTALPAQMGLVIIGGEGAFVLGGLAAMAAGAAARRSRRAGDRRASWRWRSPEWPPAAR